jgi:hypothetical protein
MLIAMPTPSPKMLWITYFGAAYQPFCSLYQSFVLKYLLETRLKSDCKCEEVYILINRRF